MAGSLRVMAADQPAAVGRLHPGLFGGRREFGEERQSQLGPGAAVCSLGGRENRGHRGTRRRLRRPGRRRLRDHSHRQPGACHATCGGLSGGGLALGSLAPGSQTGRDKVGVGAVSESLRRVVFLDRDGVLNRPVVREGKPYPPASPDELEIVPEATAALAALRQAGFALYVVTNQPDVARGTQRRSIVEAMHAALRNVRPLDGFYVCYHDDADACECRKPKPGLLLTAAEEHGISLPVSYMIGDRWRDIEAGRRAGCRGGGG